MNRNSKPRIFAVLILIFIALALSLSSCKDFSFFSELGIKGGLSINPSEVTAAVNSSVTFTAAGGNPPYTYGLVSGTGSIDAATGVYTAPAAAGNGIVVVTDSTGQSGTAAVTVMPTLEALKISPTTASVSVGNSISFVPTGGVGTYTFNFQTNNSGGNVTPGGVYTAGSTTGVSDTIIVTDSDTPPQTCSVPAVVSVTGAVTNIDYSIPGETFPPSAMVGSSISGDFTIHNGGSATGTASISWWLFISEDGTFGGDGEHLVASGTVTDDILASGDYVVAPTGNWPSDLPQGNYDLFVMVSSPDDLDHGNNVSTASAFTLNVPNVDYRVLSVTHSDPTPRYGQSFSGEFQLDNAGTNDSTVLAQWEVWISENTAIDAGDVKIDSGTETSPAMTVAEASKIESFSGTWPHGSGNSTDYYIIVRISSTQDSAAGNNGNNTADSGVITVYQPQVNYDVISVSHSTGDVAGRMVTGTFELDNIGTEDGSSADVEYTVYASTNTGAPDPSDTVVAFGTTAYMTAAESTKSAAFTGTWPATGADYYLIVDISHPDDIDDSDNVDWTTAPVTVRDVEVDYEAEILVGDVSGVKAGNTVSGTFTLTNNGPDDSLEEVEWSVYASADTTLDVSDWLIQSTTDPGAYNASDSQTIAFSGTWPYIAGDYYLLVKITSAEDVISGTTGNNIAVSLDASGGTATPISVSPPTVDYAVTSVSYIGGSKDLGGNFTGEFRYENNGAEDGAMLLDWAAYASIDTTLDPGDVCVASGGGLIPLASSASSSPVPFSGVWPYDYGDYYLFVEVISQDNEPALSLEDNQEYDLAPIAVGYYTATPDSGNPPTDPNGDFTNLVDVDDFAVTLKPGTSLHISGIMDNNDLDDVFKLDLDPTTTRVTVSASWDYTPPPNRRVTLWFFIGPSADDDGFLGRYVDSVNYITVVWEPYKLPNSPHPTLWLDIENYDLANLGNYQIIITAN